MSTIFWHNAHNCLNTVLYVIKKSFSANIEITRLWHDSIWINSITFNPLEKAIKKNCNNSLMIVAHKHSHIYYGLVQWSSFELRNLSLYWKYVMWKDTVQAVAERRRPLWSCGFPQTSNIWNITNTGIIPHHFSMRLICMIQITLMITIFTTIFISVHFRCLSFNSFYEENVKKNGTCILKHNLITIVAK